MAIDKRAALQLATMDVAKSFDTHEIAIRDYTLDKSLETTERLSVVVESTCNSSRRALHRLFTIGKSPVHKDEVKTFLGGIRERFDKFLFYMAGKTALKRYTRTLRNQYNALFDRR